MPTTTKVLLDPNGKASAAMTGPIGNIGQCKRDNVSGLWEIRVTNRLTQNSGGSAGGSSTVPSSNEVIFCNHQAEHPVCFFNGSGLEFFRFYPERCPGRSTPGNDPTQDVVVRLDGVSSGTPHYPNYGDNMGIQQDANSNSLISDGAPWSFASANLMYNASKGWPICLLYEQVTFPPETNGFTGMTKASLVPQVIPTYPGDINPNSAACSGAGLDISLFYPNGNAFMSVNNMGAADIKDLLFGQLFGLQQDQDHGIIAYNPATGAKRWMDLLTNTVGGDCGGPTGWACGNSATVIGSQNNYPQGAPPAPMVNAVNSSCAAGCVAEGDTVKVAITYATNRVGESNASPATTYQVPGSDVCTATQDHGGALPCNDLLITSPVATPSGKNFTLTHYNKYVQDVTQNPGGSLQLQAGGATMQGRPTGATVSCSGGCTGTGSATLGFYVIANDGSESSNHATGIPSALVTSDLPAGVTKINGTSNSRSMTITFTAPSPQPSSYTLVVTDTSGNPYGYAAGACSAPPATSCVLKGQSLTQWALATEKIGTNGKVGTLATSSLSPPVQSTLGLTAHNLKVGLDACWIRVDASPTSASEGYGLVLWNICTNEIYFQARQPSPPAGQNPGGGSHQAQGFNYEVFQMGNESGADNFADTRWNNLVAGGVGAVPWSFNKSFDDSPGGSLVFGFDAWIGGQLLWTNQTNTFPQSFSNICNGGLGAGGTPGVGCPTGGPNSGTANSSYDYAPLEPWQGTIPIWNPVTGEVYVAGTTFDAGYSCGFFCSTRGGFTQFGEMYFFNSDLQQGDRGHGVGVGNAISTSNTGSKGIEWDNGTIGNAGTVITVTSASAGQVDALCTPSCGAPTTTVTLVGTSGCPTSADGTYNVVSVTTASNQFTVTGGSSQNFTCQVSTAIWYSNDCTAKPAECNADIFAFVLR